MSQPPGSNFRVKPSANYTHRCSACDSFSATTPYSACSRCHKTHYCSKRKHWPLHKEHCKYLTDNKQTLDDTKSDPVLRKTDTFIGFYATIFSYLSMWAIHFHGGLSSIDLPNTYICIFLMPRTSEEHKGNPSLYYTLENIEFRPLKEHSDRKDYLDSVKQGASARGDNILVEYRVITEKGAPLSCWSAQPLFACAFINSYAQQIMKVEKEGPNGYFERAKFVVNNGLLVRHQLQDSGWNSMEDALNVTPSSGDSKLSKLGKLRKDGKKWIWQEITNEEILALGCSEDITNEWFFF